MDCVAEVRTISFIAGSFDARSHETGDRSLVGQSRPLLLVVMFFKTRASRSRRSLLRTSSFPLAAVDRLGTLPHTVSAHHLPVGAGLLAIDVLQGFGFSLFGVTLPGSSVGTAVLVRLM